MPDYFLSSTQTTAASYSSGQVPSPERVQGRVCRVTDSDQFTRRLFREAVQQGRGNGRGDAYPLQYIESLSAVRMPQGKRRINNLLDFCARLLAKPCHERLPKHALILRLVPGNA